MKTVLIVYATKYGQTKKIAERMADLIRGETGRVIVASLKDLGDCPLTEFEAVLVGTPVFAGRTDRHLRQWVRQHSRKLALKRTGLFLVALNPADPRPEARVADQRMLHEFMSDTDLAPQYATCFAGAINFREYGFFTKFILKRISRKAGGPIDTTRDHELTDWNRVTAFAQAVASGELGTEFDAIEDEVRRAGPLGLRASSSSPLGLLL